MRFFFIFLFVLNAQILFGQEKKVTFQVNEQPLIEVLEELETAFDVRFSYSVDDLSNLSVSINQTDASLDDILKELFQNTNITYEELEGRFITLTKNEVEFALKLKLIDEVTKAPLPYATARVKGTYKGFVTNENGVLSAVFKNPDSTVLELSFVGYKKVELNLAEVDSGEEITVEMPSAAQELKGLTVKEYLTAGISMTDAASAIQIDLQNLEILPGLPERDVLLSAQILAGVSSADESAGGLNVRGSSRANSFIYWNNIPIYQSAHYFGNISAFIPSAIGGFALYRNYIPSDYGGASAALMILDSRELNENKAALETNLNLTHADLYAAVPFAQGKGELMIAGRRSFNDIVPTPTFNAISKKIFDENLIEEFQSVDEAFTFDSKLVFDDLNLVARYEPNSKNEISFSALRSSSSLDYSSELSYDNEVEELNEQNQNTQSAGFNLSWTNRLRDRLSLTISSSFTDYEMNYQSRYNIEPENPDSSDSDVRTNELSNWENRLALSAEIKENHVVDFGYQLNVIDGFLNIRTQSALEEDIAENISTNGLVNAAYASYFGKWKSGFQWGGGLRVNHYSALDEIKVDQHFRLNYEVNKKLLLKSAVGIYHQYVSTVQEVDFIFSNTIEQNWIAASEDAHIPVVSNQQVVIGALFNSGKWMVDLDVYQKRVFAPVSRNFGPAPEGEDTYLTGNEIINGMDLTLKRRWKYYRVWISYAFQDSEVDAAGVDFPSGLNIPHQAQLSQTWMYKRWQFSLGYTYRTGLPYTKATGFTQEIDDDEAFFEITYEDLNSSRLPDYHRVDFSTWYRLNNSTDAKFKGEIGVSFLNVLNTQNLYSRTYSLDELDNGNIVIEQMDRALLGFTPNLSIRLKIL